MKTAYRRFLVSLRLVLIRFIKPQFIGIIFLLLLSGVLYTNLTKDAPTLRMLAPESYRLYQEIRNKVEVNGIKPNSSGKSLDLNSILTAQEVSHYHTTLVQELKASNLDLQLEKGAWVLRGGKSPLGSALATASRDTQSYIAIGLKVFLEKDFEFQTDGQGQYLVDGSGNLIPSISYRNPSSWQGSSRYLLPDYRGSAEAVALDASGSKATRIKIGSSALYEMRPSQQSGASSILDHEFFHAAVNKKQFNNTPTQFAGYISGADIAAAGLASHLGAGYVNGYDVDEAGAFFLQAKQISQIKTAGASIGLNLSLENSFHSLIIKQAIVTSNLQIWIVSEMAKASDADLSFSPSPYGDGIDVKVKGLSSQLTVTGLDKSSLPTSGKFSDLSTAAKNTIRTYFKNSDATFRDLRAQSVALASSYGYTDLVSLNSSLSSSLSLLPSGLAGGVSKLSEVTMHLDKVDQITDAGAETPGNFLGDCDGECMGSADELEAPISGSVVTADSVVPSTGTQQKFIEPCSNHRLVHLSDEILDDTLTPQQSSAISSFVRSSSSASQLELATACGGSSIYGVCFTYSCIGRANPAIGDTVLISRNELCSTTRAEAEFKANLTQLILNSKLSLGSAEIDVRHTLPANFTAFGEMPLLSQGSGWLQGLFIDKYNYNFAAIGLCAPTSASMVAFGLKGISKYSTLNNVFDSKDPKQTIPLRIGGAVSYRSYDAHAVHIEYMSRQLGLLEGSDGLLYSPDDFESMVANKTFFKNSTYNGLKLGSMVFKKDDVYDSREGSTYLNQLYTNLDVRNLNSHIRTDIPKFVREHKGIVLALYSPSYAGIPNARSTLDSGVTINRHAVAVQGISGNYIMLYDPWGRAYHVQWTDVVHKIPEQQVWVSPYQRCSGYQWVNNTYTPLYCHYPLCNQQNPHSECFRMTYKESSWDTWALTHVGSSPGGYIGRAQTPNHTDGLSKTFAIVTAMFTAEPWPMTSGQGLLDYRAEYSAPSGTASTHGANTCTSSSIGTISFRGRTYKFRNPIGLITGNASSSTPVRMGCLNLLKDPESGEKENFFGTFDATCVNGAVSVSNVSCDEPLTPLPCDVKYGQGMKYPELSVDRATFGSCKVVSCNPGFTQMAGKCTCEGVPSQFDPEGYDKGIITQAGECQKPPRITTCPAGYVKLAGSPENQIQCARIGSACPVVNVHYERVFKYPIYKTKKVTLDRFATSYVVDSNGYCNIGSCGTWQPFHMLVTDLNGDNHCMVPPKAFIEGQPTDSSAATKLNVTVIGPGQRTKSYAYKVGAASLINCKDSAGYSASRDLGLLITDDISALPMGKVELCVQAIGKYGERNPNPISATWKKVPPPASTCLFNNKVLAAGASIKAYRNEFVPNGQTCVSENRVCGATGILSGSFGFKTCKVLPPDPSTQPPVFQIKSSIPENADVLSQQLTVSLNSKNKSTISYIYKVIANSATCGSTGYSSPIPLSTPILINMTSLNPGKNRICVIGVNGLSQRSTVAEYTFNKPDMRPIAIAFKDGLMNTITLTSSVTLEVNTPPNVTLHYFTKIIPMDTKDSCRSVSGYKPLLAPKVRRGTVTDQVELTIGSKAQFYKACIFAAPGSDQNVALNVGFESLSRGAIGRYIAKGTQLVQTPGLLHSFPPQAGIEFLTTRYTESFGIDFISSYKYKWYCPNCTLKNPNDTQAAALLASINSNGDCKKAVGYTAALNPYLGVGTESLINFSKFNGVNIICQVVADGAGTWQSYANASRYEFDSTHVTTTNLAPTLPTVIRINRGNVIAEAGGGIGTAEKSLMMKSNGDLCLRTRQGGFDRCLGRMTNMNCTGSCRLNFDTAGNLCLDVLGRSSCAKPVTTQQPETFRFNGSTIILSIWPDDLVWPSPWSPSSWTNP